MADEAKQITDGTAQGLVAFLEWAGEKGELKANTASSYRTAVQKVMEIDGEAWTSTELKGLDVEHQLERFAQLRARLYNPDSLRTYGNRFRAAVNHYLKFIEDPANFRGSAPRATRSKSSESDSARKPRVEPRKKTAPRNAREQELPVVDSKGSVNYPFPLRPGVMVTLTLPRDLRRSEAKRIAAFVDSLAIDTVPELLPGPKEAG